MAINNSKIRSLLLDAINDQLDEDTIEMAMIDAIGNLDFSDTIATSLEYALQHKLVDYIDCMVDEAVEECVDNALERIFD